MQLDRSVSKGSTSLHGYIWLYMVCLLRCMLCFITDTFTDLHTKTLYANMGTARHVHKLLTGVVRLHILLTAGERHTHISTTQTHSTGRISRLGMTVSL